MSHAALLVVTKDCPEAEHRDVLAGLLAPFDEGMEVEPYEQECWCVEHPLEADEGTCEECGGTGVEKSTYNPQSRWDWWVVGGRYAGRLASKANRSSWATGDSALKGDLDMAAIRAMRVGRLVSAWTQGWASDNNPAWRGLAFGIDAKYGPDDMEEYVRDSLESGLLSAFSLLTAEGWSEPGRLGWFGTSTESDDGRRQWNDRLSGFIAALPPEARLTYVDYHI